MCDRPEDDLLDDEEFDDDDDYSGNMPCDTYGLCAESGCSKYRSGECDGY